MNKDKVFIGYTKEGKRCLLYKKKDDKYIDLETKIIYKNDDILQKTLVSYKELMQLSIVESMEYHSKRKIKKKYKKEYNKDLELKDIFIGDIIQVTDITETRFYGFHGCYQEFQAVPISSDHLLERQYDNAYRDLLTNEVYNKEVVTDVGYLRVSEKSSDLTSFNIACKETSSQLSKKKVLKKYQDKYGLDSYK